MPVARQKQIPQGLRAGFLSDELHSTVGVPLLSAHAARAHLTLYLDAVVVLLRNSANDRPVVLVPVPPFREDRGGSLELGVLGADLGAPDVGVDDEFPDVAGSLSLRNISQNLVEVLELALARFVLDDAPVFPQTPEVEVPNDGRRDDEGGLARCRRQLLEVPE